MVSMYFIVTGLFVMQSKWWLKITPPKSHRVELMTLQHWKSHKNLNTPIHASTSIESISTIDTAVHVHINRIALAEFEDTAPASGGTVDIPSEGNEPILHGEPQESGNADSDTKKKTKQK